MSYRNGDNIDRRWLDWHYNGCPPDFALMDLDGLLNCNVCREPLALIETSRDPETPTTILRKLAHRAEDLPAYLIVVPSEPDSFNDDTVVRVRRVWPEPEPWGTFHDVSLRTWCAKERQLRDACTHPERG